MEIFRPQDSHAEIIILVWISSTAFKYKGHSNYDFWLLSITKKLTQIKNKKQVENPNILFSSDNWKPHIKISRTSLNQLLKLNAHAVWLYSRTSTRATESIKRKRKWASKKGSWRVWKTDHLYLKKWPSMGLDSVTSSEIRGLSRRFKSTYGVKSHPTIGISDGRCTRSTLSILALPQTNSTA